MSPWHNKLLEIIAFLRLSQSVIWVLFKSWDLTYHTVLVLYNVWKIIIQKNMSLLNTFIIYQDHGCIKLGQAFCEGIVQTLRPF